jgi:hypothetical protein
MAITDRRLKLLNLSEENVSDLRAAVFVGTRATVNINNLSEIPNSESIQRR